jgi:hypothetical protein
MPVNPYFQNLYSCAGEQDLLEDLYSEAICQYGMDIYYVPRTLVKEDYLFGEDTLSAFEKYYTIEMYLQTFDGYEGEGDLLTKFGYHIKDEAVLDVSIRRFKEETSMDKPLEGDLVYIPMLNVLMEIRFVEDEESFYQLGKVPSYKLRCSTFEYSMEDLETGIDDVDAITDALDGTTEETESFGDNDSIETEGDSVVDITEQNVFGSF